MKDRQHQADLRERISRVKVNDLPLDILAWVVPGGGKSWLPGILAQQFPNHKLAWFVPRLSLQKQAVKGMKRDFGIVLRDSGNDCDPSRGTRGFVTTHAALTINPMLWRDELRRRQYLLVIDEIHHAKLSRDGVLNPLAKAIDGLSYSVLLNMTGTLETNDGRMIYGMHYEPDPRGFTVSPELSTDFYIRYDRSTALRERAIVPIEFQHFDGPVKWHDGNQDLEVRLSEAGKDEESASIFTALRTNVAQQLFESGLEHWRRHGHKLIVVCDSQSNAGYYHKRLKSANVEAALAITDNEESHQEIERFREQDLKALVTCQMAYEGLDVPAASHLICLTHIRSVPWIEQAFGRIWRAHHGKSQCWAFVPDDARMNRVIEQIQKEQLAHIGFEGGGGGDGGSKADPVLALNGFVDATRQAFLDGQYSANEAVAKIQTFAKSLGLRGDEPEVAALIALVQSVRVPEAESKTVAEEEQHLRKQIADECRKIDADTGRKFSREPTWGDTQKRLIRLTDKSITEMNRDELKRAFGKLQTLRPR